MGANQAGARDRQPARYPRRIRPVPLSAPLARGAVLVLALVVCAWFALRIRETGDTRQVAAALTGPRPPAASRAGHLASLLQDARLLNPDTQIDLLRAQLAVQRGDRAQARTILAPVLRREPMNIAAWVALARASQDDRQTFERALRRARQLAPVVPPPP